MSLEVKKGKEEVSLRERAGGENRDALLLTLRKVKAERVRSVARSMGKGGVEIGRTEEMTQGMKKS